LTIALLQDSETAVLPEGAGPLIIAAQFVLAGPVIVADAQLKFVTNSSGVYGNMFSPVVFLLLFNDAVSVAFRAVPVEPAEAVKGPKVCLPHTVTRVGTVTVELLLDSETGFPQRVPVH
jgi:hypothetical protein